MGKSPAKSPNKNAKKVITKKAAPKPAAQKVVKLKKHDSVSKASKGASSKTSSKTNSSSKSSEFSKKNISTKSGTRTASGVYHKSPSKASSSNSSTLANRPSDKSFSKKDSNKPIARKNDKNSKPVKETIATKGSPSKGLEKVKSEKESTKEISNKIKAEPKVHEERKETKESKEVKEKNPPKKDVPAKKSKKSKDFEEDDLLTSDEEIGSEDIPDLSEFEEAEEIVEKEIELEDLEESPSEVKGRDDEVVLTDAEGRVYCRVRDCDQISAVEGYCRYHYLLLWKKIQVRRKILVDGKLERYVEELTARYPDKFLEMIRKDLRSEKDFLAAIAELEIDESANESEFEEDEAQNYVDEMRGISTETSISDDEEY